MARLCCSSDFFLFFGLLAVAASSVSLPHVGVDSTGSLIFSDQNCANQRLDDICSAVADANAMRSTIQQQSQKLIRQDATIALLCSSVRAQLGLLNQSCLADFLNLDSYNGVGQPSLALTSTTGIPVIVFPRSISQSIALTQCLSTDCSSTTTRDIMFGVLASWVAIVLDSQNIPLVVLADATSSSLILVACSDQPCAVRTTQTLDSNNGDIKGMAGPSIALTTDGFPVIAYYDTKNANLKIAVCQTRTCSTKTIKVLHSANITSSVGSAWSAQTLRLNNNNNKPVIAHMDFNSTYSTLMLTLCNTTNCSQSSTITLAGKPSGVTFEWFPSLALRSDGSPVVSYFNPFTLLLDLVICMDQLCSNKTVTTLSNNFSSTGSGSGGSSSSVSGLYASLQINPVTGAPVVSYFDQFAVPNSNVNAWRLIVTVCGDSSACVTRTTRLVDGYKSGVLASLAVASTGNPVIVFKDLTNGEVIRLVICHDSTCT